jgi:hypothetical protein
MKRYDARLEWGLVVMEEESNGEYVLYEDVKALEEKLAHVRSALAKASEHLDYCGYGDSWERECAIAGKLEETIQNALADTEGCK